MNKIAHVASFLKELSKNVKKISHLKPNQLAPSIYIMKELCFFSLDQWEIYIHLLWGKCFNIPHWLRSHSTNGRLQQIEKIHHCDPHLNQTKFNDLLPLTIDGVIVIVFVDSIFTNNKQIERWWMKCNNSQDGAADEHWINKYSIFSNIIVFIYLCNCLSPCFINCIALSPSFPDTRKGRGERRGGGTKYY